MWQLVLLTALGGALTIAGTIAGHNWQAAENRRVRRERYEREDRYRLFRDRIEAYRAFNEAASAVLRPALKSYQEADRDQSLVPSISQARMDTHSAYIVVRLIGDGDVVLAASKLLSEADEVRWRKDFDPDRWGDLIINFVGAARTDLILEDDASSEWLVNRESRQGNGEKPIFPRGRSRDEEIRNGIRGDMEWKSTEGEFEGRRTNPDDDAPH